MEKNHILYLHINADAYTRASECIHVLRFKLKSQFDPCFKVKILKERSSHMSLLDL